VVIATTAGCRGLSLRMPRYLSAFLLPALLTAGLTILVFDPLFRYFFVLALLPAYQRGAALTLGVYEAPVVSRSGWLFKSLGVAALYFGWTLIFAIVSFTVAVGVLDFDESSEVMKRSILLGAVGFLLAAWFWWPYYARDVLMLWPKNDSRIFVKASNHWDELFRSYRLQQIAELGSTQWIGFGSTSALILVVMMTTVLGAYEGVLARIAEITCAAILLPAIHLLIVQRANQLCERWQIQTPPPANPETP
jgi:hypothetical protein